MVATSDFSGLARAAAIATIVSLDRYIAVVLSKEIKADSARLRTP
jgi:hypothetical protein